MDVCRGLSSHTVGVEFSPPLKQIYSPMDKDHYVNTTVEHYGNVFVHKGGKLENRQFLAKMHQIAPNCVSNFKIFPGVTPQTPIPGEGDTPSPYLSPTGGLIFLSAPGPPKS